jgi:hypothetical protein
MITEVPEQLAGEAMGFLEPRDLGSACHALGGSQALAETACWCALRRPWDDIELYAAEETWRSLYAAQCAMTRILAEHIMTDQPDSLPTLSNIARYVLTGLKPRYEMLSAGLVFVERALVEIAPMVSRQRLVAAARRLGRDGKWEVAAELLRAALADNDDDDDSVVEDESTADDAAASSDRGGLLRHVVDWLRMRRNPSPTPPPREAARVRRDALAPRWAAQLRLEASTFLVDRLYASTYVYASDGDGECVARALREGRAAVRALVAFDGSEDDAPAPSDSRWAEVSLPPLPYQLAEARLAHGRAAALCAQHVALGASHSDEDWHNIFQEGSDAFETVRADGVDAEQRARAAAGLAELWYCQASAKSLRLRDHASFEAVQSLARRSIAKTQEAATMLKDLGKVHGFLASIFGGSEATSRQFLAEALRIQQRLDRPAECETENIQRLMRDRPNNLADLEAGDILTLDGDQIDVVLHDVAEQQQNQPDDDDDDDNT